MFSKSLAIGALAAGCVAAAAGGAYVSVRHNTATEPVSAAVAAPSPNPDSNASVAGASAPVAETEAIASAPVEGSKSSDPGVDAVAPATSPKPVDTARDTVKSRTERPSRAASPASKSSDRPTASRRQPSTTASRTTSASAGGQKSPLPEASSSSARETHAPTVEPQAPVNASTSVQPRDTDPVPVEVPAPPAAQFEELVVPASSVIGLRVETPLSTERARVEDRVDARVTRDVMVDGRAAVPAGARAVGSVILVERGGKMKDRARLGVRFNTLVLADGTELPINTEAIYREGESPSGESARKIGGAAVGGAILGALIGGKKGAVVGGATGAAGGTAVVMAGDRNAATLPAGTIVTIRLAAPVGVEVEKR